MRIVFFGTPEYAVPSLQAIHAAGYDIPLVVTQPDRASGRSLKHKPPPAKVAALELGIPVFQPDAVNADASLETICAAEPDVLCVIAYGEILHNALLKIPALYPLNAHGSILPRWRGASPIQAAIRAGDTETGVTIMRVVRKLDAGDIALIKRVAISPTETGASLHDTLAALSADAFVDALSQAQRGALTFTPQDESHATITRKLTRSDGVIDFSHPAIHIERTIRAFTPWPGTSGNIVVNGKRVSLKILGAALTEPPKTLSDSIPAHAHPGDAVIADARHGLWIRTGRGSSPDGELNLIELTRVQLPGKKSCTGRSFLAGFK